MSHLSCISEQLTAVRDYENKSRIATIDGVGLNVPAVIAVARRGVSAELDSSDQKQKSIAAAVAVVQKLALGEQSQYGITTGFGGSATTRTKKTALLQKSLLAHCQAGILPAFSDRPLTPSEHDLMFPQDWIRATMFVRLNSLIRAQSGTRWLVIKGLHALLERGVAPCVPLRQSISASGDLGPLAYISAVLTGSPDVHAWYGEGADRKIFDAASLLRELKMEPIEYIAKEGLSLVNGTGASTAVASFAMHDCHTLAASSQVLSAFAVEVFKGSQEPFHPYLHASARPHAGQIEVASTIRHILAPSRLARVCHVESDPEASLRQDVYCLRGVPQWLGPQLEDLLSAQGMLDVELNSTTDNPIVEVEKEFLHHGANFLAMSVTSATEKMRLALHHIAKLMYAQLTDLLNNKMNRGLPPNLSVGEPSIDYSLKGADIAAASYLSEIAYLANPVSTHVVSAEMHNQSINSLALVSGRYTHEAVKLLRMLMSTHLYALCQAVDLRAMESTFRASLSEALRTETTTHFPTLVSPTDDAFFLSLYNSLVVLLNATSDLDSAERFQSVISSLTATLLKLFAARSPPAEAPLATIESWRAALTHRALTLFSETRDTYDPSVDSAAAHLLGRTRALYVFVRGELGVRMRWGEPGRDTTEVGTEISKIFRAFEGERIGELMVEIMRAEGGGVGVNGSVNGHAH